MNVYLVKDEDGEIMRKVPRKEEAVALCGIREGWTYTYVKTPIVKPIDLSKFEECPF